jgi:hypothetical protein
MTMRPSAWQKFSDSSTADFLLGVACAVILAETAFEVCYPVFVAGDAAALATAFRPESRALVFLETSMFLALTVMTDIPSRLQRCEPLRQQAELLVWSQLTFGLLLMVAGRLATLGRAGAIVVVVACSLFVTFAVILLVKQYRMTRDAALTR